MKNKINKNIFKKIELVINGNKEVKKKVKKANRKELNPKDLIPKLVSCQVLENVLKYELI